VLDSALDLLTLSSHDFWPLSGDRLNGLARGHLHDRELNRTPQPSRQSQG
jgi:hypothetical protein